MLIRQIEAFMRETKMPQTRFGRLAAGDPRLIDDLRKGRRLRPRTRKRVEHFMNTYRETSYAR
jgi:hypothetical protein